MYVEDVDLYIKEQRKKHSGVRGFFNRLFKKYPKPLWKINEDIRKAENRRRRKEKIVNFFLKRK